jgi:methionyl-tRNA formyltransferase
MYRHKNKIEAFEGYKAVFLGYLAPILKALIDSNAVKNLIVGYESKYPQSQKIVELCEIHKIPVFCVDNIEKETALKSHIFSNTDIAVVGAFGQILSKDTLKLPKYGFLNFHPSYLPDYRGGSPIEEGLLRGEHIFGYKFHWLVEDVDAGPMVYQERLEFQAFSHYPDILNRLSERGGEVLFSLLNDNIANWPRLEQSHNSSFYYSRKKGEGTLEWSESPEIWFRKIKAFGWRKWAFLEIRQGSILIEEAILHRNLNSSLGYGKVVATKPTLEISLGKFQLSLVRYQSTRTLLNHEDLMPIRQSS